MRILFPIAVVGAVLLVTILTRPVAGVGDPLSDASSISAGYSHACALTADGAVKCWGQSAYGQVGDGTYGVLNEPATKSRPAPVDVVGLSSGVIAISAGYRHTCAVLKSGGAKCWGANPHGELGAATIEACPLLLFGPSSDCSTVPIDVAGLEDAIQIAAGGSHTCALALTGAVKCWGTNGYGQLGGGSKVPLTDNLGPVSVVGLDTAAIAVATGTDHTCAVTTNGRVKCWGTNEYGQLGAPKPVFCGTDFLRPCSSTPVDVGISNAVAVAAGYLHTCALTSSGEVKCWGSNGEGQLGDGQSCGEAMCLSPVTPVGLASGSLEITAGYLHSCAGQEGGIKCWGNNYHGQIGDGSSDNRFLPVQVLNLPKGPFTNLSAGGDHTCAVPSDGRVLCWGSNVDGQLGSASEDSCGQYEHPCSTSPLEVLASAKPTPTPTSTATPLPTQRPPSRVPGDADCDYTVTSRDAALVLQYIARLTFVHSCLFSGGPADANGDSRLDSIDVLLILQYVAGLIDSLPP